MRRKIIFIAIFTVFCLFINSRFAAAQGGKIEQEREETVKVTVSGEVTVEPVFRDTNLTTTRGRELPVLPPWETSTYLQLDVEFSEKISLEAATRIVRLSEGGEVDVSVMPTGKGADFRKWEVRKTQLNIDGEKLKPAAEEKFYVTRESFFRKPAAIVFAAIGSQYERYADKLQPGEGCHVTDEAKTTGAERGSAAGAIDRAGMAAGMGLLTSQAAGDITGKKFIFNLDREGMKRIDGVNDKLEILLENKERHQEEKIEIPLRYQALSRKGEGEGEAAQETRREANRTVTRSDGDVIELWEGGYIQVVRRGDGTIIVRLGQTQIERRQGSSEEVVVWPDGTTTTRRRGETELTPRHHVIIEDDGTVIERSEERGFVLVIEYHADGTKVRREYDGHTIWTYPDGHTTERWPDNREVTRYPDGREVETLPDTTEITRYPDERREVELRPDNTVIERRFREGVEIESRPRDGVVIVRFSYGPIREIESHSDLTEITRYRDGREVTQYRDGTMTSNRPPREVGPGVGRSDFRLDPKSRIKPHEKPDVARSRKKSKKLSEKSKRPFYGCDEWGRPQVWINKDEDPFLDTVRTYDYGGRPLSEIQWLGVTSHQFRVRIYHTDGSYIEYIDTDNDGIMDKKVIVDSQGNTREEPTSEIVVIDPAHGNVDKYGDFDANGRAHLRESYDANGNLRQRTTWDENGNPTVETWDADGNLAEPGSWNPARDWAERARDEFRHGTGIDGNPSPYGAGGADYEWTEGEDGVPRPRGLVEP